MCVVACRLGRRVVAKAKGGGGGKREDEPTPTVMGLMSVLNSDIPQR